MPTERLLLQLHQDSEGRVADALGGCSRLQLDGLWKNLQQICTSALGLEALPPPTQSRRPRRSVDCKLCSLPDVHFSQTS